jgi:hypothetical protein
MIKTIAKLGIGPMSPQIVEAVFSYSQEKGEPLMLIASKNQIDHDGGYCGNWNTLQYGEYIGKMKQKYQQAKVFVCRDHCGPGFKNDELEDVYKTIDADLENGFDLIHVDFCHFKGSYEQILEESKKAITYILKRKPQILLEVGTDENTGAFLNNLKKIENEMNFFSSFASLHFFVCQTGSLVKEVEQVGGFNKKFLGQVRKLADKYQVGLKEHNCDYIEESEIKKRKGLVDAVNVAPQFGVIQTSITLQKAYTYGIDPSEFLTTAYQSGKWKKWLHKSNLDNKFLCSLVAGHYVFSSNAYQKLYEKICRHENLTQVIINELSKNFDLYLNNL